MARRSPEIGSCELCERRRPLTFHHLIPRALHSKKSFRRRHSREELHAGLDVCLDCHSAIHQFIPLKELGLAHRTRTGLLEHPDLADFVAWVRGRETGRIRTRRKSAKGTRRRGRRAL